MDADETGPVRMSQERTVSTADGTNKPFKWIQLLVGVLLSGAGLIVVLRGVDWQTLARVLQNINLAWFLLSIVVQLITLWVGALRWRWIFWPHPHPPVAELYGVMGVAQLANLALPGKLGFPLRAVILGRKGRNDPNAEITPRVYTIPLVFSTLLVEKVLEGVTLLVIAVLFFLWSPSGLAVEFQSWTGPMAASGVVLLGILAVMVWLAGAARFRDSILERLDKHLPAFIVRLIRSFLMGLDSLRSGSSLGWMWGLALLYWGMIILINISIVRSVDPQIPWAASVLLLVILQIGVRIPSAPGNLGVFDYLGVLALAVFNVDKSVALGITLLLHLVYFLPPALVGVGYLLWTGTGLSQITRLVRNSDRRL